MRKLILKGATPKEFALSGELTIGSQPGNKLVLKSPKVAANHAKIARLGEHTFIEDLNTPAGVLLNGKKITRSALKKGDVVDIGGVVFTFDDDGKPDAPAAKPAAAAPAKQSAAGTAPSVRSTQQVAPLTKTPAPAVRSTQQVAPVARTPAPQAGIKPPPTKTPLPQPGVKAPNVPTKTPTSSPAAKGPVPTTPGMSAKLPAAPGFSAKLPSLTTTPARSGALTPPGQKPVPTSGMPNAGASAAKMLAAGTASISVRGRTATAVASAASSQRRTVEPPSMGRRVLVAGGVGVLILGLLVVALLVFKKKPEVVAEGPSAAEKEALQRLKADSAKDPKDLKTAQKTIFACKKWTDVENLLGQPALKIPDKILLWDPDKGTTTQSGHEFRAYYINDNLALRKDSQVVSVLLFAVDNDDAAACMGMRIHALKETPPLAKAIGKQEEYRLYQEHLKKEQAAKAAEEKRQSEAPPANGEPAPKTPPPQQPTARSF